MMFAAGLVVVAAVVGTSAQMSGISQTCQQAATGLLTGPAGECLGVSGLLNVAMTPANQSIVDPLNNWLKMTCSQPACSAATLDSAITNITNGCATEFGVTNGTAADIKAYVEEWYLTARDVACLQDSNAGDAYCVTTTLKNIESWTGQPITINSLSDGTLANVVYEKSNNVPKDLTCTPCVQAAYGLIRPKLNDSNRGTWDNFLGSQCGSSFTTGSSPSSIKQSANSSTQGSSNNGASALSGLGALGAALLGMAGIAVVGF
ncbi:hypothetical protein RhiJN_01435 [Ceratobasidium sp. AG-Ba]|nr:hypothetical protein RhiJN_01435 [Ceratobasidium sp. AG-Ba]